MVHALQKEGLAMVNIVWNFWAPSKLLSHAQPMGGSRQEAVWWTEEITKEIADC